MSIGNQMNTHLGLKHDFGFLGCPSEESLGTSGIIVGMGISRRGFQNAADAWLDFCNILTAVIVVVVAIAACV